MCTISVRLKLRFKILYSLKVPLSLYAITVRLKHRIDFDSSMDFKYEVLPQTMILVTSLLDTKSEN